MSRSPLRGKPTLAKQSNKDMPPAMKPEASTQQAKPTTEEQTAIAKGKVPQQPDNRIAEEKNARAEMRRAALRKILQQHRMNVADASRAAGLPPNVLYNFLSKQTASLSQNTYEKLAQAFPGVTKSMLHGMDDSQAGIGILVRAEARAGSLRPSFDLDRAEQIQVHAPISADMRAAGAFGVVVRWPGAEELYPPETILICVPPSNYEAPLTNGRKLILQRIQDTSVEVTVREVTVRDGRAWLWPRSTSPDHQTPIAMPWPSDGTKMWKEGDARYSIAGVVIMSCIPEG